MKPIHTGIAVGLALFVVLTFFIFPNLSPFGGAQTQPAAVEEATTNNNTATMPTDTNKLMIKDDVVGTGAVAEAGDTVTVQYVGSLTNGTVFDASTNHGSQGFTFILGAGQVIAGWDQGVAGMKEGGKRSLVIPPDLAYGNRAIGNIIPANSTLVFQVELVKVEKAK